MKSLTFYREPTVYRQFYPSSLVPYSILLEKLKPCTGVCNVLPFTPLYFTMTFSQMVLNKA